MPHDDPHSEAADAVHEGRPVEAQYTRQGKGGARLSIEMGFAIALTVIGFVAAFLVFSGSFRSGDTGSAARPGMTAASPDAPKP
jgi:hypothetical protein